MKTASALLAAAVLLTAAAPPVFADPEFGRGGGHWDRGDAHYRSRGYRDCDDGYRRGFQHRYYPGHYESHPVYYAPPSYHYYHHDRDHYYHRDYGGEYRDDDHHRRHNGGNHNLDLLAIIGGAVLVDRILLER